MRRDFFRKIFSGTEAERFDATKRISDYVGMITRMVFLSAINGFVADQLDFAKISSLVPYDVGLLVVFIMLAVLSAIMTTAFIMLTYSLLLASVKIDRPRNERRVLRWAFEFILPLTFLIVALAAISLQFVFPGIVREIADRQMHRTVPSISPTP